MTKARDIADGTRYVDVTGDTMTGALTINASGNDQFRLTDGTQNLYLDTDTNGVAVAGGPGQTLGGVYLHNSVGNVSLFTNNALRMTVDTAGRVTMPYQPAFYAYRDGGVTTMSTASDGANPVYNQTVFNIGNNYNTTNGVFTAPVSGVYYFAMGVYMFTNSGYNRIRLDSNTGILHYKIIPASAVAADHTELLSGVRYLSAGDTCFPTLQSNGGNTYFNASNHSWFEGRLLG